MAQPISQSKRKICGDDSQDNGEKRLKLQVTATTIPATYSFGLGQHTNASSWPAGYYGGIDLRHLKQQRGNRDPGTFYSTRRSHPSKASPFIL